MPKMKTHRGAAKRFRRTGTGKFVRRHAKTSHLFTGKSRKSKRQLSKKALVSKTDSKRLVPLLPYR